MALIEGRPTIQLEASLKLYEREIRALSALTEFGEETVVKIIGEQVSANLVKEHRDGLVSFLKAVRHSLPGLLTRVDEARRTFNRE